MNKLVARTLLALLLCGGLSAHAGRVSEQQKAEINVDFRQNTAYEFIVNVDFKTQRFRFVTFIPNFESPTEGVARQRELSGWVGDYLFVRHQCGQLAEWRCIVDELFTLENGRLIHIGGVESAACQTLGCRYQPEAGTFLDLYDVYRINPVTGATDVPALPIVRRVNQGALVTDMAATWRLNAPTYQANIACLNQVAKIGFETPCENNLKPWSALAFLAKLTHYANQFSARDALFSIQATGYCAKSADPKCQWRVAGLRDFFSRFASGANPIFTPSPVTAAVVSSDSSTIMQPQQMPRTQAIKLGQ